VLKNWRVHRIFNATGVRRVQISEWRLLAWIGLITLLLILYLAVWTSLFPPRLDEFVVESNNGVDEIQEYCYYGSDTLSIVLNGIEAFSLFIALKVSLSLSFIHLHLPFLYISFISLLMILETSLLPLMNRSTLL